MAASDRRGVGLVDGRTSADSDGRLLCVRFMGILFFVTYKDPKANTSVGEEKITSTKSQHALQTPAPCHRNSGKEREPSTNKQIFPTFSRSEPIFRKNPAEPKVEYSKISFFRFRLSSRIFASIHLPVVMDSIENPLLSRYERRPIYSMN